MLRYFVILIVYAVTLYFGVQIGKELSFGEGRLEPPRIPAGETREIVFIGNEADGTVTLIDTETWTILDQLNALPDGRTVSIYRDITQSLFGFEEASAYGSSYVSGLALSPPGDTLYVSRTNLADVIAFDLRNDDVWWRRPVAGYRAGDIALSAEGDRLFVMAPDVPRIDVIETIDESLARDLPLEGELLAIGRETADEKIAVLTRLNGGLRVTHFDPLYLEVEGRSETVDSRDAFLEMIGEKAGACTFAPTEGEASVTEGTPVPVTEAATSDEPAEEGLPPAEELTTDNAEADPPGEAIAEAPVDVVAADTPVLTQLVRDGEFCVIVDVQARMAHGLNLATREIVASLPTGAEPAALISGKVPFPVLEERFGPDFAEAEAEEIVDLDLAEPVGEDMAAPDEGQVSGEDAETGDLVETP